MEQEIQGYKGRGQAIEERMRRFFKGAKSKCDEVDFETSTSLYEVKSCRLFNKCFNGNHKRPYKEIPHKQCETMQMGRFQIKTDNHILLYLRALMAGKIPKYIFAVMIGQQCFFRVIPWDYMIIHNDRDSHYISIRDIFYYC